MQIAAGRNVLTAAGREKRLDLLCLFYFVALAVALPAVTLFLEISHPVIYVYLIAEDKIGEYATALSFMIAAALFFGLSVKDRGLRRLYLLLGALACFGIAGEEISWGQRIFGVDTPEIIKHENMQGEITIHNMPGLQTAPFHAVAGLFLLALVAFALTRSNFRKVPAFIDAIPRPPIVVVPLVLMTAFVLLIRPFVKGDEIGELFFGLTAMAWATQMALSGSERLRTGLAPLVAQVSCGFIVLLDSVSFNYLYGGSMGWRYNITASRDYPKRQMYDQADVLFSYILSHPELIQHDTMRNYRIVQKEAAAARIRP